MPELPPWLVPADPAAHLARGYQLGLAAASQQTQEEIEGQKQSFYEQQAAKEQQLAANRDARAQAELQLQSSAAARKSEALLGYQKAIQEGADPLKAMLQYGPAMGQPATSIAAAQRALSAKMMTPAAPELVDLGGGVKGVRMGNQFHVLPQPKTPAQWQLEERQDEQGNAYQVQVNQQTGEERPAPRAPTTGRISQVDRDELREMERESEHLQTLHDKDTMGQSFVAKNPKSLNKAQSSYMDSYNTRAKRIADLERQIEEKRASIRGAKPQPGAQKSKVDRAKELSRQHPEWNKQQVIDAVNQEYANASSAP